MLIYGSNFHELFLKKVTKGKFLWHYFKIWPAVSEKIFLKIFSEFREQFLKRVTQGTFLWNYFKIGPAVPEEKIFKELLKKNQFRYHGNQSFLWNQILWTLFKEDLPRNIPAKFGPNWSGILGWEDV